jgi:hypothetical protein
VPRSRSPSVRVKTAASARVGLALRLRGGQLFLEVLDLEALLDHQIMQIGVCERCPSALRG